jgi:hypothetical protein
MTQRLIVNHALVLALITAFSGHGSRAAENASTEEAIWEIRKLRGTVTIDEQSPGKLAIAVALRGDDVRDAGLEQLTRLPQLRTLDLSGPKVTDAVLEHLKGLTQLRTLDLFGTKVTGAGEAELKKALPKVRINR